MTWHVLVVAGVASVALCVESTKLLWRSKLSISFWAEY